MRTAVGFLLIHSETILENVEMSWHENLEFRQLLEFTLLPQFLQNADPPSFASRRRGLLGPQERDLPCPAALVGPHLKPSYPKACPCKTLDLPQPLHLWCLRTPVRAVPCRAAPPGLCNAIHGWARPRQNRAIHINSESGVNSLVSLDRV